MNNDTDGLSSSRVNPGEPGHRIIERTGISREALAGRVAVVSGAGQRRTLASTGARSLWRGGHPGERREAFTAKPLLDHSVEEWDRIFVVNLRGAFPAIKAFLS